MVTPALRLGYRARKRAWCRWVVVVCHVGFTSVCWVCYRFVNAGTVKPNAVMPAHGLHSVRYLALLTWLIMFTARLDALPKPFRVACFRARRSTHAFRVLPNAVRRVQVMGLASCNALNTVKVYVVW